MDDSKIVFSLTVAQLRVLRAIGSKAAGTAVLTRDMYPNARRDPAESLRSKGLIESADGAYGRWNITPFGRACIAGTARVVLETPEDAAARENARVAIERAAGKRSASSDAMEKAVGRKLRKRFTPSSR